MGNWVSNTAVLVGSWIAIEGLFAWRAQLLGKRRIDLAEEVLALAYQARDVVQYMRDPISTGSEGASRPALNTESPEERRLRNFGFVPAERFKNNSEAFSRLQAIRYRYMVWFGVDVAQTLEVFRQQANRVIFAARSLAEDELRATQGAEETAEQERRRVRNEQIRWDGWAEAANEPTTDPVRIEIDNAVKVIEAQCQRILRSEGSSELLLVRLVSYLFGRTATLTTLSFVAAGCVVWLARHLAQHT